MPAILQLACLGASWWAIRPRPPFFRWCIVSYCELYGRGKSIVTFLHLSLRIHSACRRWWQASEPILASNRCCFKRTAHRNRSADTYGQPVRCSGEYRNPFLISSDVDEAPKSFFCAIAVNMRDNTKSSTCLDCGSLGLLAKSNKTQVQVEQAM